jgi:magnesium-transporting ATPase (P-type)
MQQPTSPPGFPDDAAPWHAWTTGQALQRAGTDAAQGLSAEEAARRRAQHGPNLIAEAAERTLLAVFLSQFKSPLVVILVLAAVLAAALGHGTDAAVIVAVVLVNAALGTLQEGRAARSMAALRRVASVRAHVVRDGREVVLAAGEVVPGDILLLSSGDAVAADARLLEEAQLQCVEAALTGESVPVAKSSAALEEAAALADRHNMVYCSTYVTSGRGRAVVVATGPSTEVGRIAQMTQAAPQARSPLELRLERFGRALLGASLALFVAVLALGVLRSLPMDEVLMVAISQMVSMVPEGLPVAMTIALAVGMQRMAARGAIVRRLSAVETLGSTTVICTDKTGTLTRNEMTVVRLVIGVREIEVQGQGYAPAGGLREGGTPVDAQDAALRELLEAAVLCNDAGLAQPQDERGEWTVLGDPTEGALLVVAAKAGLDAEAARRHWPRVGELVFDTQHKMMATAHADAAGVHRVIVKGAPEAVLRLCAHADAAALESARAAADRLASRALRVLAVAVVDGRELQAQAGFEALDGAARLLGLVGQIDPPRPEAAAAVAACRAAGIQPMMVTGDHKLTGMAIARELGIARDGDLAIDGSELERMNEAELHAALAHTAVFARVQPAQKLRIVEALQARGEVVAMTGDGVNDAPALARADVGVAMGITGTEVAKSAARIVITDDNFSTIVAAVEQGRVVYANLKKVILYLFATSLDEVLVLLLALMAGFPLPLQAVQILWINIVTEGTVTVNLVMEPADGDEMCRSPVARDDPLLDRGMLWRLAGLVLLTVGVTFGWFAWRLGQEVPIDVVRTEVFTLLAMCQWFNVLNCRSATRSALGGRVWRNPWLLGGLLVSVLLQLAVLYVPLLNETFYTVPLPWLTLLALLALASVVLWGEELRKLAARRARAA